MILGVLNQEMFLDVFGLKSRTWQTSGLAFINYPHCLVSQLKLFAETVKKHGILAVAKSTVLEMECFVIKWY